MMGDGREGGFIKLYRRIKSWPLWQHMTALQRQVVIEILLSANWKPAGTWNGTVERGELAHSEETIAREAKVSRKVVRQAISLLVAEGFLRAREVGIEVGSDRERDGHEKGPIRGRKPRVLFVVNYERYQGSDTDEGPKEGQPRASRGPSEGQPRALREEGEEVEEGKKPTPAPSAVASEPAPAASATAAQLPLGASPFARWLAETWPDVRDPVAFEAAEREANPGVDLLSEARRARAWEIAEPSRKKHRHGKFLHAWFARAQDRPQALQSAPVTRLRPLGAPGA